MMESQYVELTKACEHEDKRLKTISRENEDLSIEIDNLSRKIAKW